MPATIQSIEALHAEYIRLTGRPVELDYLNQTMWIVWLKYCKTDPFTIDDLRLVVPFLKEQIRKGNRREGCLKFHNLIKSPDWFMEDRTDARAAKRAKAHAGDPARRSVLAATGRAPVVAVTEKRVDKVLADAKALKDFQAWRKREGY